jgi:hypothetical protein
MLSAITPFHKRDVMSYGCCLHLCQRTCETAALCKIAAVFTGCHVEVEELQPGCEKHVQ